MRWDVRHAAKGELWVSGNDAIRVVVSARHMRFLKIIANDMTIVTIGNKEGVALMMGHTHAEWRLVKHIEVTAVESLRILYLVHTAVNHEVR